MLPVTLKKPSMPWFIFFGGLVFHLAYIYQSFIGNYFFPMDEPIYLAMAERIVQGFGMSLEDAPFYVPSSNAPTMFWTPGYPFVVALFAWLPLDTKLGLFLFQSLLAAALPPFVLFGFRSLLNSKALMGLCVLAALYPFYYVMTKHVASEILAAFLFSLLLAMAITAKSKSGLAWCGIGAVSAALILTRPEFLFSALFVMLWKVLVEIQKDAFKTKIVAINVILMVVTFALLLGTWLYRNHKVSGEIVFSTRASYSLVFQNMLYAKISNGELNDPEAYFDSLPRLDSEKARNDFLIRDFAHWLVENPIQYLKACARRAAAIVTPYFVKKSVKQMMGVHDVGVKTSHVTPPLTFVIANDLYILLFWLLIATGFSRMIISKAWKKIHWSSPAFLIVAVCAIQYAIYIFVIHTWYQRSITDVHMIGLGLYFHHLASRT